MKRVVGARRLARVAIGSALVLASVLAMGVLTRVQPAAPAEGAELRLAWRTRVPRVEECRRPTAEELAELPAHMRQTEICEGRNVRYRLEARVDGEVRHRSEVTATGARGDRPMHVLVAIPLEPGERHVRVTFERADTTIASIDDPAPDSAPAATTATAPDSAPDSTTATAPDSTTAPGTAAVPARLVFDRVLDVGIRDVVLITYDRDGRRLVRKGGRVE